MNEWMNEEQPCVLHSIDEYGWLTEWVRKAQWDFEIFARQWVARQTHGNNRISNFTTNKPTYEFRKKQNAALQFGGPGLS